MANANKYTLNGGGIEVIYNIGIGVSFTALTFKEGSVTKEFKGAQITTTRTPLGELVSVELERSVDTGGSSFGFFLPVVEAAQGQKVRVTTLGVLFTFSGPDTVPHRPTTWHGVHMHGTAETVIHPL
jgi:hypothetical protein